MSSTTVGIGELVETLREEFPRITISKIRFLESKALIVPSRTNSGYRRFSEELVARIREILRLQRDEYLPLEVIAKRMERWLPTQSVKPASAAGPFTVAELARAAEVNAWLVEELTRHGVLREGADGYPTASLAIVEQASRVLELGLEPRHLRSVRTVAASLADSLRGRSEALSRSRRNSAPVELSSLLSSAVAALSGLNTAVAADEIDRLSPS